MTLPTRRDFLQHGLLLAAAASAGGSLGRPLPDEPRRVVLVVLGGGVRAQDTLDHPENTPVLRRLAAAGVQVPNGTSAAADVAGGLRALLTGVAEETPPLPGVRPHAPTLFEVLRKETAGPPTAAWFLHDGSPAAREAAPSAHADYGQRYAPVTMAPEVLASRELAALLDELKVADPLPPEDRSTLRRLVGSLAAPKGAAAVPPDPLGPADAVLALQSFIIQETRGGERDSGPGAPDRRILRAATALFLATRPRLMVAALSGATVAEHSFEDYQRGLRGIDELLGRLWDAVTSDPALAAGTAIIVASDVGRNRKVGSDGTLRRDDGSADLSRAFLVAAGAGVQRGQTVRTATSTVDVAPTAGAILGVRWPLAKGKVIRGALV